MSETFNNILSGINNLLVSMVEQATKEAQSVADTDEINDSLKNIKEDRINKCDHGVSFDSQRAASMSVSQVRNNFPRLCGTCPKGCGYNGIYYASFEHYVMGDW